MNFKLPAAGALLILSLGATSNAAEFQTSNFLVVADSSQVAQDVAQAAENLRSSLARQWLGRKMDDWKFRCRITVDVSNEGGSGWTSYDKWNRKLTQIGIRLQGPLDRLMDYVLPHELTHAILVTVLGDTPPRWADEGAAMLAESRSQRLRQRLVVDELLKANGTIPLRDVLCRDEYPRDLGEMHAFYTQSLALTEFLVDHGGRARFLKFVRDGYDADWDGAVKRHYEYDNVEAMQEDWIEWLHRDAREREAKRTLVRVDSLEK